jgi:parallel beta-helix repeat protein
MESLAQPALGNWVVTGTEVVQSESITLNGNLTIESGGNLTLRNVNLALNASYNGEYAISVFPGGSLYIYNSKIVSAVQNYRFSFVADGSNFVMENSELHGVGWWSPRTTPGSTPQVCLWDDNLRSQAGLVVETSGAVIEDNVFSADCLGLIAAGSYAKIEGNKFGSNDLFALGGFQTSFDLIYNNTFEQNPVYPLDDSVIYFASGQNNTFSDNTIWTNESLIQANSTLLTGPWRMDGLAVYGSLNTIVLGNTIATPNNAVFLMDSQGSLVTGNNLTFGEIGVSLLGPCVNTRIVENTLVSYPFVGYGGSFGIFADLAYNSVFANNTISGQGPQTGIYMSHTSNSSILNNKVEITRSGSSSLLVILGSRNDAVIGNNLSQSMFGLILSGSDGNLIARNAILADHSITLLGSSSNHIFLNDLRDFSEPTGGPFDNGHNSWYNGSSGNYWSYFSGQDQSGNGIGDVPYNRTIIPPNGIEHFSLTSSVTILPAPMPYLVPIPIPVSGGEVDTHLIANQVFELDSGGLPGNLEIVNSTVYLAKTGPVQIGDGTGPVTIENSNLTDMGYGFSFGGDSIYLVIKNSSISGAFLNDLDLQNITIEDSTITNSQGDCAESAMNANSVMIVNSTFSGAFSGIGSYPGAAAPSNILYSGNKIENMVGSGISVSYGARNVTITRNTISGCLGGGIDVNGNSTVDWNNVSGVESYGSVNLGGNDNIVFGNTISNERYNGICASGSGNLIYDNNVTVGGGPIAFSEGGNLVYHNNFFISSNNFGPFPTGNTWDLNGEGNYWSTYRGKDANLDGIGDTPYPGNGTIVDNYPFMRPNGWLTKFFLTMNTNLPAASEFQINGTTFNTGTNGIGTFRLGYLAAYKFAFPQTITLSNGTVAVFSRWADGYTSPSRTLALSSNSTTQVFYQIQSTISCSVSSASLVIGSSTTVSGTIIPARSGVNVTLSYTMPNSNVLTRIVASASDGSYSDTYDPSVLGSWSVIASWPGDSTSAGATSASAFFTVSKIATTLSCSVSSSTPTIGDNITISGTIGPIMSGKTVTLTYTKPDGTTVIRTVTTGSDGSYSDSYKPDTTGSWSVIANWQGDSQHLSVTSQTALFNVKAVTNYTLYICGIIAVAIIVVAGYVVINRHEGREKDQG